MPTSIRGRIVYTSNQPQRQGHVRGMEHFVMTLNQDGSRSLRSHCVIQDPPMVERDVLLSVDSQFHPRSAIVKIRVGDLQEGSALFHFSGKTITASGHILDGTEYSETRVLSNEPSFFVTHPIQADAWLLAGLGIDVDTPKRYTVENFPTASNDHRGATGPRLEIHEPAIDIYYLGKESITVAAGTFEALHFCYGDPNEDPIGSNAAGAHPRYHVWTSADGHFILLRASVDGYMQTHYELHECHTGKTGSV